MTINARFYIHFGYITHSYISDCVPAVRCQLEIPSEVMSFLSDSSNRRVHFLFIYFHQEVLHRMFSEMEFSHSSIHDLAS